MLIMLNPEIWFILDSGFITQAALAPDTQSAYYAGHGSTSSSSTSIFIPPLFSATVSSTSAVPNWNLAPAMSPFTCALNESPELLLLSMCFLDNSALLASLSSCSGISVPSGSDSGWSITVECERCSVQWSTWTWFRCTCPAAILWIGRCCTPSETLSKPASLLLCARL